MAPDPRSSDSTSALEQPPKTPTLTSTSSDPIQDTGPIPPTWKSSLLQSYNQDLTTLDSGEETLLLRLQAIQKLQLLWATAGRVGEMERVNVRVKTRVSKVLLEDGKLSKKRRRLEGVMMALEDVVRKLDDGGDSQGT